MKITLTGASGFIGKRLLEKLSAEGHDLRVLGRKLLPGVSFTEWDSESGEPPAESVAGADAIIHLAGEPVAQRWTDEAKRKIRGSRVAGTRHLVHALSTQSHRPMVLICGSAIGIYGDRGNQVLNESSKPGHGFLAEVCQAWEREADLAASLGIRVVKLRTGVVLGKDGGALQKMLPPFRAGAGGRIASGQQWMSWIHLDDLTDLILHALTDEAMSGAVNGTAPNPVRNLEFTHALAKALHRPAIVPVPAFGLKLLFGEMAEMVLASQRVIPEAALTAGFTFHYPELGAALAML